MNTSSLAAAGIAAPAAAAIRVLDVAPQRWQRTASTALKVTSAMWLGAAAMGQVLFAFYVLVFYGGAAVQGRPELWNKILSPGYVPGDAVGNIALAAHLLCAVLVTAAGALQLTPAVRRRWPRFHRWNGRAFLACAVIASMAGLLMVWTRQTGGDLSQHIGISFSGLLIFTFAGLAFRYALARKFDVHRRWAMRLFLVVNTGWFFRIGLMLWIVANHGPAGFDPKTFTGPFLTFLSFADYLVPLAVLEIYFRTQASRDPRAQGAMASALLILTLAMIGAIAAAAAILWVPNL